MYGQLGAGDGENTRVCRSCPPGAVLFVVSLHNLKLHIWKLRCFLSGCAVMERAHGKSGWARAGGGGWLCKPNPPLVRVCLPPPLLAVRAFAPGGNSPQPGARGDARERSAGILSKADPEEHPPLTCVHPERSRWTRLLQTVSPARQRNPSSVTLLQWATLRYWRFRQLLFRSKRLSLIKKCAHLI